MQIAGYSVKAGMMTCICKDLFNLLNAIAYTMVKFNDLFFPWQSYTPWKRYQLPEGSRIHVRKSAA